MQTQKKLSVSQNALYNTVGTIFYCFCQWLTSAFLVVHLSPEDISVSNTGLLQLSISVTNIFYSISLYSTRTYQISDIDNRYSDGIYIATRFVTAVFATLLCLVYVLIIGYSANSIICIMFYMLYKLSETFSDVYHGIDQKNYRMDYVGISYILRGIFSVIAFVLVIVVTGNVLAAVFAMAISTLAVVAIYDVRCSAKLCSVKPVFEKKPIATLLVTCFPAVISTAAFAATTSVPRQILEGMRGEEALGYYGTIATPLVVVQVMATSIFNPMITQIAEFYHDGKIRNFIKMTFRNLLELAAISGAVCVGVALLGEFAVGIVFGKKFVEYTYLMYGIIACTTMYVVSWLCTNYLIIMRKMWVCTVASLAALATSSLLAKPFINRFGMNGVSYSIIIAYVIHIAVCGVIICKNLKARGKSLELQ